MATDFHTVPGVYAGPALNSRNIFSNSQLQQIQTFPSFAFVDGTNSRDTGNSPTDLLRAGLIMGKVTSGGKMRNSIIGLTTADTTAAGTTITVAAPVATEVARLITNAAGNVSLNLIGPPVAGGTVAVTAITCSAASGTTLTVSAVGVIAVTGSIIAPADGSQIPRTVLKGPYAMPVLDTANASMDHVLDEYLRGADLIATQIINLTEGDAAVQAWLKAALKANGPFTFDNDR